MVTLLAAHPSAGGSEATAAWLTALASLAAVIGGVIVWSARKAWRVLSRILRFLDDYFGEPARDGIPARPGVMARLGAVEAAAASAEATAAKVLAETRPNGGSSLRDVVQRTAKDVSDIKAVQGLMRQRVEQLERQRQERDSHD